MSNLLIFAPHPDDAEIHAGGIIAAQVRLGHRVVVVDATRGELGSRGDASTRAKEAAAAAKILGLAARDNLGLGDGAIPADDPAARVLVVDAIRRHQPRTVLCLDGHARHPDHRNLANLVTGAIKAAALHRLQTPSGAAPIAGVRLLFCEAELPMTPTALVPLTEEDWARKMAAVRCYGSQLVRRDEGDGPATSISDPAFLRWIEARGRTWGYQAGADYAEALASFEPYRIIDLPGI